MTPGAGPRVGITLGDPGGIGPEIVASVLRSGFDRPGLSCTVFGSRAVLEAASRSLGFELALAPADDADPEAPGVRIKDLAVPAGPAKIGVPDADNGRASFAYFREAVQAARRGAIQGLATAPVSKKAWEMAGLPWRGHTEYLDSLYPGAIMSFWSERLAVALFSHHLPLREALSLVTARNLVAFLVRLDAGLARWRSPRREYLVAGLNPHAGEGGLLGREETEAIRPAIEEARRRGLAASGPYPPDVVFRTARTKPGALVVALYHDQGLIPFKLEAFETGVNATIGPPFVRTSPDHGTAFDIAGRGAADPRSMAAAVRLAIDLAGRPLEGPPA